MLVASLDLEEYDINKGYSLVFLYTAGSAKLRDVYNLVTAEKYTNGFPGYCVKLKLG